MKKQPVGRPEYEPTHEDRAFVENAAAVGIAHTVLSENFGIDPKTLRKHFRTELNSGMLKAHMQVGAGLFNMATKSKDEKVRLEASKWYSARQMGWKETVAQEVKLDADLTVNEGQNAREFITSELDSIAARSREDKAPIPTIQ